MLAGRRGDRRPRASTPVVGLVLLGVGIATSAYGAVTSDNSNGALWIAASAIVSVLGMILVVPVVVSARGAAVRAAAADGEVRRPRRGAPPHPHRAGRGRRRRDGRGRRRPRHRQRQRRAAEREDLHPAGARWAPASSRGVPTSCPARRRPTRPRRGTGSRRPCARPHPTWRSARCAGRARSTTPSGYTTTSRRGAAAQSRTPKWVLPRPTGRRSPSPTPPPSSGLDGGRRRRSWTRPWLPDAPSSSPARPDAVGGRDDPQETWREGSGPEPTSSTRRAIAGRSSSPWDADGSARRRRAPSCRPRWPTSSGSRWSPPSLRLTGDLDRADRDPHQGGGPGRGRRHLPLRRARLPAPATRRVIILLVLGALGGVLMLGGTLTATFLALSDARPDLATLSAVGAAPRTRRRVAAAYALVIGFVGAILGAAVGFIPGVAISRPLTLDGVSGGRAGPLPRIPWLLIADDRARAAAADRRGRRADRPVAAAAGGPPRLSRVSGSARHRRRRPRRPARRRAGPPARPARRSASRRARAAQAPDLTASWPRRRRPAGVSVGLAARRRGSVGVGRRARRSSGSAAVRSRRRAASPPARRTTPAAPPAPRSTSGPASSATSTTWNASAAVRHASHAAVTDSARLLGIATGPAASTTTCTESAVPVHPQQSWAQALATLSRRAAPGRGT